MKRVWIGNSWSAGEHFKEKVAEVLGMDNFDVELFGVGYNDTELPQNYRIVDYGSRETIAVIKDGESLSDEEMEMDDNIDTMMQDVDYSYEAIKAVYYDERLQEAISDYDWDEATEILHELMKPNVSEQVREKAKYFNMRIICAKSGVNYDTFKSWSCGRNKKMKEDSLKRILNTMKKVAE